MHDTDERNAPINTLNLFSRTSNSHHYNSTLSSTQNFLHTKKSKLDIQNNAFSRVGATWNEMPNNLENIARKTFRKKLKGDLLNILKTEDNYIDNDKIMARLKKY